MEILKHAISDVKNYNYCGDDCDPDYCNCDLLGFHCEGDD